MQQIFYFHKKKKKPFQAHQFEKKTYDSISVIWCF